MKSNIHALRQRKVELHKSATAMLDCAASEGRDLTLAEKENHNKLIAALKANEAQLIAEEKRMDLERAEEAFPDENALAARAAGIDNPAAGDTMPNSAKPRPGGKKYADLFGRPAKSAFHSFGEYIHAVNNANQLFDPRLRMASTESMPSNAGFLDPTEFSRQLLDESLEAEVVRPRALVWPMASDTRKIPATDDTDHSGGSLFGGVTAAWADELETLADQTVKIRLIELHANKLGMLSQSSNELLEDSDFETILGDKLQIGASWHLDTAFLFGDGAGKPLGILNAGNPALVTVLKESSQPADGVVFENILKMYAAMAPRHRLRATWVFNDGLIPSLYAMQNRVFNLAASEVVGGSATPVFSMNADGTGTLLTRPVIFSEKLSAPGDLGDALFCDFGCYGIGLRREVRLEKSTHAGFASDSSYFRLTCRVDGQPTWRKAVTPKHGTAQSPYVTLQAR